MRWEVLESKGRGGGREYIGMAWCWNEKIDCCGAPGLTLQPRRRSLSACRSLSVSLSLSPRGSCSTNRAPWETEEPERDGHRWLSMITINERPPFCRIPSHRISSRHYSTLSLHLAWRSGQADPSSMRSRPPHHTNIITLKAGRPSGGSSERSSLPTRTFPLVSHCLIM